MLQKLNIFLCFILLSSVFLSPIFLNKGDALPTDVLSIPGLTFQNLKFVNENGAVLLQPDFCKPYGFTATIENAQSERLKLLVSIQAEDGTMISLNWIKDSRSTGQPYFPSSWAPGSTGTYTITAYLYQAERPGAAYSVPPLSMKVTITKIDSCMLSSTSCNSIPVKREIFYEDDLSSQKKYDAKSIKDINYPETKESITSKIVDISLPFVENKGQTNKQVKYYSNTFAGTVFVTSSDLTYVIQNNENGVILKEKFLDGKITPIGHDKNTSKVNYFIGSKENWISNVDTYDGVSLGAPWESVSVDLKFRGNNIEKIFTVYPGGNLNDILLAITGANLSVDDEGKLLLDTDLGVLSMSKPYAYQDIGGMQKNIPVSYVTDGNTYGFEASYDPKYPLVIDPLLASTFLGGRSADSVYNVIVGENGCVYVTGQTNSMNFPTRSGSYRTSLGGNSDVFVSAFDLNLSRLIASSYIGGSGKGIEAGIAIDMDGNENVVVTGYTGSPNFPTTNAVYDTSFNGATDTFVFKMNSNLSSLLSSTLIGGQGLDAGHDVVIGQNEEIFITGFTESPNYPALSNAYDDTFNERRDAFISRFNNDLSTLMASTFVGGDGWDWAGGIAHDSSANIYITGVTASSDFPMTSNAYDGTLGGTADSFISRFDSNLSSLQASTFLGGTGIDFARELTLDFDTLSIYVTGVTQSSDFPVSATAYDQSLGGTMDGFVSKLNLNLTDLIASTYIGSDDGNEETTEVDFGPYVVVTGYTDSPVFPVTGNVFQTTYGENGDGFVSVFATDLSSLNCSTYLGGSSIDYGNSIYLKDSTIFVTGITQSSDFPVSATAYDQSLGGTMDGFVSKLTCEKNTKTENLDTGQSLDEFIMSDLLILDGTNEVNTANVGTTLTISAKLQNNLETDQRYAFYVVITDARSRIIYNVWTTGTASSGSEYIPSFSWTPENTGRYTIQTIVRSAVDSTYEIAPSLSREIRIS